MRPCDPWRLLSALYYIAAGLVGLVGPLAGLIIVAFGIRAVAGAARLDSADCDFGAFLIVHGALAVLIGGAFAAGLFATGRNLVQRRSYWACFLLASYLCLLYPLGAILGVPTLVLLTRPGMKKTFTAPKPAAWLGWRLGK